MLNDNWVSFFCACICNEKKKYSACQNQILDIQGYMRFVHIFL